MTGCVMLGDTGGSTLARIPAGVLGPLEDCKERHVFFSEICD